MAIDPSLAPPATTNARPFVIPQHPAPMQFDPMMAMVMNQFAVIQNGQQTLLTEFKTMDSRMSVLENNTAHSGAKKHGLRPSRGTGLNGRGGLTAAKSAALRRGAQHIPDIDESDQEDAPPQIDLGAKDEDFHQDGDAKDARKKLQVSLHSF